MEIILHILALSGIYGLFACGLTLIFGFMEILNLAHAVTFAFSAVFAMFLTERFQVPLWLACVMAILSAGLITMAIDQSSFRPLRHRGQTSWGRHMGPLLTSLGAGTVLLGLERSWFGIDPRHFPNEQVAFAPVVIGDTRVNPVAILTFAVFVLVLGLLLYLIHRTRWGIEIRAVAERSATAELFGINAERRYAETMGLAGLMAGMAGVAWALVFNVASPETGAQVDVKGFALIILGGMGSVLGSLVGAVVIASIEMIGGRWLPSGSQTLIVFLLLIVLLIVRPQGLLGTRIERGAR